jgi:protein Mpv17
MLRQFYRLLLTLSLLLVLVSSWAPPTPTTSRLSLSSRTASSFLVTPLSLTQPASVLRPASVSCRAQMNDQLDNEGPLTPLEMTQEVIETLQGMDTEELIEKAMNACLLLAAFGFSFYTMVTIDHEFTRGWTQQEIAMRIPLDNWASYESALAEKPIMTKTFINVVIYSLGDWLSQTVFQKKNVLEFDVSRTLRNGFIGLCFGPLVHMYYEWSDTILPVEGGLMNRVQKVFMDQTLYLTIKCSIYIAAVGILQGDDLKTVKETIQDRIGPICFTAWKFWPLVHCVTYGVIPGRHRMLWVNCVDLVWNAILASMSRKEEPVELALAIEGGTMDTPSVIDANVAAMRVIPEAAVERLVDGEVFLMERTSDSSSNVTQAVLL